ncbi:MAG: hypothetical protein WA057_05650 [Candidatus Magasanikiibacteriota bacterium]
MKNYKFIIILLFVVTFLLPNITEAIPGPRSPKIYIFSQLENIGNSVNKVTTYKKTACFSEDKYGCLDTLKYARPIFSFTYNTKEWELTEDENESQLLINKQDSLKQILIYNGGNYNWYFDDASLYGIVKEKIKDDVNIIKLGEYEMNNGLIYLYDSFNKEGYDFYFTRIPITVMLKAKKITQTDIDEYKNIIKSIDFTKLTYENLAYDTYTYPQGTFPKLFYNVKEVEDWGKLIYKSQNEVSQVVNKYYNDSNIQEPINYYTYDDPPNEVLETIKKKNDNPPNYSNKNFKFVGQNEKCEKDNILCIDESDPWYSTGDYTDKNISTTKMLVVSTSLVILLIASVVVIVIRKMNK